MARLIARKDINCKARPQLAAIMKTHMCYLLAGTLAKTKRQDQDGLTIWAERGGAGQIIIDEPAFGDESEHIRGIWLDAGAVDTLAEHLAPPPPPRVKLKDGRPTEYGLQAKLQARKLHDAGLSIRKIAAELGCSPRTVQRLLQP